MTAAEALQWWYPVVAWGVVTACGVRAALDLLGPTAGGRPRGGWFGWLPIAAAAVVLVPVEGIPLGRWLHGLSFTASIPLLALLLDRVMGPLVGRSLFDARAERTAIWFGILAGLLLYPCALGLGPFDPYALGWRTPGVAHAVAAVGGLLALFDNRFGIALVAAGGLWQIGLLESANAWDHVVDPVYFVTAVGRGLMGLRASPDQK